MTAQAVRRRLSGAAVLAVVVGWLCLTAADSAVAGPVAELSAVAALIAAGALCLKLAPPVITALKGSPGGGSNSADIESGRWQGKVLQILEQQTAILRELVEEQRLANRLIQEHDQRLAAAIRDDFGRRGAR